MTKVISTDGPWDRQEIMSFVPDRIDKIAPNIRPLLCPKDYRIPKGFPDPSESMLSAYTGARKMMEGTSAEEDRTCYSIHVMITKLIKYQMPTFFVSEDLCDALLKTEAPKDLRFDEIQMPMPAMRFVLPTAFSKSYFGWDVPFLMTAVVEPNYVAVSPIKISGFSPPRVEVCNINPFFVAGMLAWEDGFPMHYDSKSPLDGQVGGLLSSELIHYSVWDTDAVLRNQERDKKTVGRMVTLAVNIILGMTAEPELVAHEKVIKPRREHGGKVRRALWQPNMIGAGFRVTYEHNDMHGTHRSPHAHWRIGHWRNQRHGVHNTLVKRLWIKPVFVGLKVEK